MPAVTPKHLTVVGIVCLFLVAGAAQAQQPAAAAAPRVQNPVVVQFMIDGIDPNTVRTAVAAGASTLGSLLKEGVTVQTYYCASPAPRLELPDKSLPEGGSTAAIVALHTG